MATVRNTVTLLPLKYELQNAQSSSNLNNMLTDSSSTTYATVRLKTGSNAETSIFLWFDDSSIPENATIISVVVKAKNYVSTTNSKYISARTGLYYLGEVQKGSYTISNSATRTTICTVNNPSRSDLTDSYLQVYVKRGTSSTTTSRDIRIYGADLTVTYEYDEIEPPNINVQKVVQATSNASNSRSDIGNGSILEIKSGPAYVYNDNYVVGISDTDLQVIELRSYYSDTPDIREKGVLIATDVDGIPKSEEFEFHFKWDDVWRGDGTYAMKLFGQSTDGVWSE